MAELIDKIVLSHSLGSIAWWCWELSLLKSIINLSLSFPHLPFSHDCVMGPVQNRDGKDRRRQEENTFLTFMFTTEKIRQACMSYKYNWLWKIEEPDEVCKLVFPRKLVCFCRLCDVTKRTSSLKSYLTAPWIISTKWCLKYLHWMKANTLGHSKFIILQNNLCSTFEDWPSSTI